MCKHYKIHLTVIVCILSSCVSYNDYCTEKWIEENKKPIIVKQYKAKQFNSYILYNDTNDFDTGVTNLILEDTIK